MAGSISESYTSRKFTLGASRSRELVWDVVGTDDEDEVLTLVLGEAPAVYLGLVLQDVSAEPIGGGVWKGSARYANLEVEYSFDTGGGTTKVLQSYSTVSSHAPTGMTAPDYGGAIGVTDDRIEGVDVPAPGFQYAETHRVLAANVTPAYKRVLAELSGRTYNDATFKGWAAGEVNFLGCSGSKRADDYWTITYRFACSANATGLSVGDITGIDKLGWDYLWVRYADATDGVAEAVVKRPVAAYVERVLLPADYSTLLIGV